MVVDRKPSSIYDYWQALNIIEEEIKSEKAQTVLPAGIEHWQRLTIIEEWAKSQKDRIIAHLSRHFEYAELLLKALDKVMD